MPEPTTANMNPCYKLGDVVGGKYEVRQILGKGGFGVVYLAYDREMGALVALKTFRDELLSNPEARNAFKKESLLWVNLEEHPHILAARWVSEVSGRLFVSMDYVAPDAQGRVSLHDHLVLASGALDTNQVLGWAIQFCLGMEHAQAHGLEYHRDIKPGNILIAPKWTLKIADFGLAAAAAFAWNKSDGRCESLVTDAPEVGFGFSMVRTEGRMRCGTPGYMAPEVYRCEPADARSDIYSFGLVLWQMAAGSRMPPFMVPYQENIETFMQSIYEQQMTGRLPPAHGPLKPVIGRCLHCKPSERYESFHELRKTLEELWEQRTGTNFLAPRVEERTPEFWNTKGSSFVALGRYEEAIECFDKALVINPLNATLWNNKGNALDILGRHEQAIGCYKKALKIHPFCGAWNNKGLALHALGRHEEAIGCFDKALVIDLRNAAIWSNKGAALEAIGRREEAIGCYDEALAIDPLMTRAWINKGSALGELGRYEEVIGCLDKALAIDPLSIHAWICMAVALDRLGRHEEAIGCFDKALTIDPLSIHALNDKGAALFALGRHEETINCYEKVLTINPQDPLAWFNKAVLEDFMKRPDIAMISYHKFLELAQPQHAAQIAHAQWRIHELELKAI